MDPEIRRDGTGFPIGVILPTYNRAAVLIRCLQHLERQTWKDFEVVVVDDGSTDHTRRAVEEYAAASPLRLRYVYQENSGPARARNQAIAMLGAPVCLMIGDDIFADPGLVEEHLKLHRERPAMEVAGLGLTRWSEWDQTVTPFMRWLDTGGMQFAYGDLLGGTEPTWRHFYTSNLSLKTELLRRNPFHEGFRKAAMEDIELGYRLATRHGLEMVFLRSAVAEHLHPTSVLQACRRMAGVGAAAYQFDELWPEQKQTPVVSKWRARFRDLLTDERWAMPLLDRGASLLTRFRCPNPLLKKVLMAHFSLGYRKAAAAGLASSSQNRRT